MITSDQNKVYIIYDYKLFKYKQYTKNSVHRGKPQHGFISYTEVDLYVEM